MPLQVHGQGKLYHGFLAFFLGDTPAAQAAGGFKVGVGSAKKPCRTCDTGANSLKECVFDGDCAERDEQEHRDRCESLENLSKDAKLFCSKEYGINGKSFLYSVPELKITQCILHDPMHVLLEGIDRLELRRLLVYLIQEKKYFSLAYLNSVIYNFNYTSSEAKDTPQRIESKDFHPGSNLHQSAASMKNLIVLLPFMVGHMVPDDNQHWLNFIRLQQINLLCFSPVASERTYNSLVQLIGDHHKCFVILYPEQSFTPKLHYLIHFPKQLQMFGPLRLHSCMRMEGKYGLFQTPKWHNFKAIGKSIFSYHQTWMCLQQIQASGDRSQTYLYGGDEVKDGTTVTFDTYEHAEILIPRCTEQVDDINSVLLTTQVKIKGIVYEI